MRVEFKVVVKIAADFLGRRHGGADAQPTARHKAPGQDGALHLGCNFKFVLEGDVLGFDAQGLTQFGHHAGQDVLLAHDAPAHARQHHGQAAQRVVRTRGVHVVAQACQQFVVVSAV